MARISINNGNTWISAAEAVEKMDWDVIVHYMDDETRERVVHYETTDNDVEFLTRYLELAPFDLIIG